MKEDGSMVQLTDMQKSALKEAGNIGSGHAAIALSQLMHKKIMITIPSVDVLLFHHLDKILTHKEEEFIQISAAVFGVKRSVLGSTNDHATAGILQLFERFNYFG